MVGFILYSVGVLLVGFIGGIMTKHIIDKDALRSVVSERNALHRENEYLKKFHEHEVIEIVDHRGEEEVKFGGF